jgi:outer membrane biosynthesis protein TonB
MRVRLELSDLAIELAGVRAGRPAMAAFSLAAAVTGSALGHVAATGVAVGALLLAVANHSPALGDTDTAEITAERRYLISRYLEASAEREPEAAPAGVVVEAPVVSGPQGGTGTRAKAPQVRMGATAFHGGRLPPETIQAIVRQNFGRFRGCYESGLRSNPGLQGTVSVQFVLGRDGAVVTASGGARCPTPA